MKNALKLGITPADAENAIVTSYYMDCRLAGQLYVYAPDPVEGRKYYHIKMNDVDGGFTYSPVRIVDVQAKEKSMLVLVPNLASANAILYVSKEVKMKQVKIYDAAGGLVLQQTVATGTQQIKIATVTFVSGIYTIEADGQTCLTTRMIVQH